MKKKLEHEAELHKVENLLMKNIYNFNQLKNLSINTLKKKSI